MTRGLIATLALICTMLIAGAAAPSASASACEAEAIVSMNDRSGCCSHHQGVCGCDAVAGKLRCCDGTNSPSCKCSD